MRFIVPQFIEKEAKIAGPLTFKQFAILGFAGAVCLFLFFMAPRGIFVIGLIVLFGGAIAFSFIKIQGISLITFVKHFFVFLFKPRLYLWKKKTSPPKFLVTERKKIKTKQMEEQELEEKKQSKLKVSRGSKIDELLTRIETK